MEVMRIKWNTPSWSWKAAISHIAMEDNDSTSWVQGELGEWYGCDTYCLFISGGGGGGGGERRV